MLRFVSALAIFALCSAVARLLPAGRQPALKLLLIAVSLILVRQNWSKSGFFVPKNALWTRILAPGLLIGALSSLGAMLFHFNGMKAMLQGYSFLELVVYIWFLSSLSEEIFCRGWFQSGLPEGPSRIWWSAILFGCMHLSLFVAGVDTPTVLWIVASTTVLGYYCAVIRETSGSIVPAFVRHAGFNIGGVLGGIVYTIGYRIATGHLPNAT